MQVIPTLFNTLGDKTPKNQGFWSQNVDNYVEKTKYFPYSLYKFALYVKPKKSTAAKADGRFLYTENHAIVAWFERG